MENVTADDIRLARESVQRIVDATARGELAAAPLLAHGIQGAVATLTALEPNRLWVCDIKYVQTV